MRTVSALLLIAGLGFPVGWAEGDLSSDVPVLRTGEGFGPAPGAGLAGLPSDTVLEVRGGDRLVVETWMGSLTVRVGADQEVRVSGADEPGEPRAERDGDVLRLVPASSGSDGDLVVEVPRWMTVRVRSRSLDVDVAGLDGDVEIELLEGDIRVRELGGSLMAETLDGEIEVDEVSGSVQLSALDGDVRLRRVRGATVVVQSTDGDLELEDVEADEVAAVTVDGDVRFRGRVAPDGALTLTTHDGDVRAWLPESLEAEVEVSTFDGSFESDFPVRTRGFVAGRPLRFSVAGGGTRVVLQSFDGEIRLLSW